MPDANFHELIATWAFAILAAVLSVVFVWKVAFSPKKNGILLIAVLFVFASLMSFPDRFETLKFSFSGVETTARAAIRDVNISIKQLQDMQVAFARGNLSQLAMAGQFFSGLTTKSKFEIRDAIIKSLQDSGVDAEKVKTAQDVWREAYCDLILNHVVQVLQAAGKQNPDAELVKLPQDPSLSVPTPDTLNVWVGGTGVRNAELDRLLVAYRSMYETGTMADPDMIPANEIVQQHIPTSPEGLKPGQVWNNGGIPSIVK